MALGSILAVVVAAAAAFVYQNNPLLFGRSVVTTSSSSDSSIEEEEYYTIYNHHPALDDELFDLSKYMGEDFQKYRNHCLRVLTFTKYFLDENAASDGGLNIEQELPNAIELAATALAYHDVGLWTDHDLNYLEPSRLKLDETLVNGFSAHEIRIMDEIILQHHKITSYDGHEFTDAENLLINAVRKGDWADATMGLVRFGLPAVLLEKTYNAIPEAGFHMMLAGMDSRLSPGNKINGTLEVLKIFKW
eukprot:CAMPEP_0113498440 /NCGR_PEP_ID=MMETSP0014_2-20120614/31180_1 /TAXON_ID=2857 /ORGANISM="Nitzschia sp." /LENGTH=247 /DNA_ID=CAMNT_0000392477 /DNA_START=524 /DNA_END=1267 /DNA_ORIENTATION=- /assembly_acc=CAM_ASM_000159